MAPEEETGVGEAYEMAIPHSHTNSDTNPPLPTGSLSPDLDALPFSSQAEGMIIIASQVEVCQTNTLNSTWGK